MTGAAETAGFVLGWEVAVFGMTGEAAGTRAAVGAGRAGTGDRTAAVVLTCPMGTDLLTLDGLDTPRAFFVWAVMVTGLKLGFGEDCVAGVDATAGASFLAADLAWAGVLLVA